jgi:3-oxoacyl-[acyl-carrier-protein] synthase II
MTRRVVVTGLGMLSPLGVDTETSWASAVAGRSGISPITSFDTEGYAVRFGGRVPDFDLDAYVTKKEARRMDGFIQHGLVASIQAVEDSGLMTSSPSLDRVGVAFGSGIGGIVTIETCHEVVLSRGPQKVSPFFVPSSIINMVAGHLSIKYGLEGPNLAITTACTTGTHNIGLAARLISYGDADVMIAGGSEKSTSPTTMAGFASMKALSTRNEDPTAASRPWDRHRDGFVLSDGAGAIVLEELEHAKARGADIYCELVGFGMSADASHMTSPAENGAGAARAMQAALKDAALNPESVDYINAHGTSTPLGDVAETEAIKQVFRDYAYQLRVSSTKSMMGHALGAAGAIEAVVTIKALQNNTAPPTINLDDPSDDCDLNYVAHSAQAQDIKVALSNSFGFGGTNGTVIFKSFDK